MIKQCVTCEHFSAGGQHPCDPFCLKGKNIANKNKCKQYTRRKNG